MSIELSGIGLRLLKLRKQSGYTQSVMAAKLDIADRTYKFYELERRELPAPIAVKICGLFEADITWLLTGHESAISQSNLELISKSVLAVLTLDAEKDHDYSNEKLAELSSYVFNQAVRKSTPPAAEAEAIFRVME